MPLFTVSYAEQKTLTAVAKPTTDTTESSVFAGEDRTLNRTHSQQPWSNFVGQALIPNRNQPELVSRTSLDRAEAVASVAGTARVAGLYASFPRPPSATAASRGGG